MKLKNSKTKKIKVVDLFCGVGGLTNGLQRAGLSVGVGIDNDLSCKDTFEKNNKSKFIDADISKFNFSNLKNYYRGGSFSVLVGCAPCQLFSSHSFKIKGKEEDKRWTLLDHFARGINELLPDIVSMENVRGIVKTDVFNRFVKNLISKGYKVDYKVVFTADYGIPQGRQRLVLLASRLGDIKIPAPTHKKGSYVTVREAIGGLPKIKAGQRNKKDSLHVSKNLAPINLKRIRQSKQGGTWKDWDKILLPDCYKKESGGTYSSVYGRMKWNSIGPTITTQFNNYGSGRFGHPNQDRALSLREGALLQTFPKNYDFGSLPQSTIARHIGNAVPPQLGYVIGDTIKKHVKQYGTS